MNESGKEQGVYIEWYDDGIKLMEANYINGSPIGECRHWFHDGSIKIERDYNNESIMVKNHEFYSEGKPKVKLECDSMRCLEISYDSITGQKLTEVEFKVIEENRRISLVKEGREVNYYSNGQII